MDVSFQLLGSGAVRTNPERMGPAQIVKVGGRVLMFDCGRNAGTQLAKAGILPHTVDRLIYTHLHFDHTADSVYFIFVGWVYARKNVLKIWGPKGTKNYVEKLVRPPHEVDITSRLGHDKPEFGLDPEVTDIEPGRVFLKEDGYQVSALQIPHGNILALAYKIETDDGKKIVVCGDGQPTPKFVEWTKGADLVAIECSGTKEFLATQPWGSWHATPPEIAKYGNDAQVKRLVTKHFVMEDIAGDKNAAEKMSATIRETYKGEVHTGRDLLEIKL